MKFDYIIGNPPYQMPKKTHVTGSKNLYVPISLKMIDYYKEQLSFITPRQIIRTSKMDFLSLPLSRICYLPEDTFNAGTITCFWILSKNPKDVLISDAISEYRVTPKIKEDLFPPAQKKLFALMRKIASVPTKIRFKVSKVEEYKKPNSQPLNSWKNKAKNNKIFSMNPSNLMHLSIAESKSFNKNNIYIDSESYSSPLYFQIDISKFSKTEINNLVDYLFETEIFVELGTMWRKITGQGWMGGLIEQFPFPSLDKKYSKNDVIKFLDLDEDDLLFIDNWKEIMV